MGRSLSLVFLCAIIFIACSERIENNKETDQKPATVIIQPFKGLSEGDLRYVYEQLKKVIPHLIIKQAIPLPRQAFYAARNRYRADTLIGFLRGRTPAEHVTIGLTAQDISVTKGKVQDYGIMGYAFQPGKACVISNFRLSKSKLQEQFFKVAIHELGHTQGLPHCPEKTCYMRDAEGKNHTNEEIGFCKKCKSHLIKRGWKL